MTTNTLHVGFVLHSNGSVYAQAPSRNQWGFVLLSTDNAYAGGFGLGNGNWTAIADNDPRITESLREALQDRLAYDSEMAQRDTD